MQQTHEPFDGNEKIGDYLRRVREARGLELNQMAKSIRLSMDVLTAIEDSRWGFFPVEAYLRSYIISICEKLSVEKDGVLNKLSSEINSQFKVAVASTPDKPKESKKQENKQEKKQEKKSEKGFPKTEVIIILIVVAALFLAAKLMKSKDDTLSISELTQATEEQLNDAEEQQQAEAQTEAEPALPETKDPNAKDTLRFECTVNLCGARVTGLDAKMIYFERAITRLITHGDTSQVIITLPDRTNLLLNGVRLD
ncbi:MAG: helix-turn-helix domain-containing protein, partial [Fibromonadaceae bacterium]|nr:helix-turn-helix domain-containing protein [Fibromonadaceae bacterium]